VTAELARSRSALWATGVKNFFLSAVHLTCTTFRSIIESVKM